MPILISSLGPKRRIIVLSQGVSEMNFSITDKYLSIMVNSSSRPPRRIEIQMIHAPIMQALTILMEFIWK